MPGKVSWLDAMDEGSDGKLLCPEDVENAADKEVFETNPNSDISDMSSRSVANGMVLLCAMDGSDPMLDLDTENEDGSDTVVLEFMPESDIFGNDCEHSTEE